MTETTPDQTPDSDAPTGRARAAFLAATALERVRAQSPVRLAAAAVILAGAAVAIMMQVVGGTERPGPAAEKTQPPALVTGGRALAEVAPAMLPALPRGPASTSLAAAPIRPISAVEPVQSAAVDCAVTLDTAPLAAAMVSVEISAPCDAGVRADIVQGDLHVAIALDEDGRAALDIPALSPAPLVAVSIADRDPVSALTEARDLGSYRRAALVWAQAAGLELHAFEGEADYGDPGHVSPETPHTIARTLAGNGGFLTVLGDPTFDDARMALIYTSPAEQAVAVAIEVPVTEANCGTEVVAATIQTAPGVTAEMHPLTFAVPGCDAVGDLVILGDLPAPVALASN
ncbi:hypothetical protein ACK8OR_12670 [Jannaschia sp. KMU-145]|uniref:hypothetical protein n=1 Tax=Jannaschia halovivens TaxID=3388667 RepID=UPI00396B0452